MAKITLIGSGHLASHLGPALRAAGHDIRGVYSPTLAHASRLGHILDCPHTDQLSLLDDRSDLYLMAVPDRRIETLAHQMAGRQGILVHCSGATPLEVLRPFGSMTGVLYPLQSFTRDRPVSFQQVPFLVEGSNPAVLEILWTVATSISSIVLQTDSGQRGIAHLSAVFVNNFSNHLYLLARGVLEKANLPFSILFPLMAETTRKAMMLGPKEAQTGPAVRDDQATIDYHVSLLTDDEALTKVYQLLTGSIQKTNSEHP